MFNLKNLTLQQRLWLTLSVVLIVMLGVAGLNYWAMKAATSATSRIFQTDARLVQDASKARSYALALRQAESDYFLSTGNSQKQKEALEKWNEQHKRLGETLSSIEGYAPNREERNNARGIQDDLASYTAGFNKVASSVNDGLIKTPQEASAASEAYSKPVRSLEDATRLLAEDADRKLDKNKVTAQESAKQGMYNVFWLIGIGAVLAVALVATIARRFNKQIGSLVDLIHSIDRGDFDARAEVHTNDELGQMALSFNEMLDNTRSLMQSREEHDQTQSNIVKLLDQVASVAEGDLTREVPVSADVTGAIADSFNFMIIELRRIISQVQAVTLQVSSSANETQATTDHLAAGSEKQAMQIMDTSQAIDEMAASIQQVSEHAVLSATVAQQSLQNSRQGTEAVQDTIKGMNRIREQVQETAKKIKRLSESSQEIGEIVQLIDDLADRTSILALNASIQAAMAGEAGRGFAVVAEEVERLSERSTDATKRIASLVKTIQLGTNEAIAAMEESTREVVEGSKLANQAGQALSEIGSVSNRLADLIQSISMASKQQARGSDALSKSMSGISEITQQTAAGIKQSAIAVNNLAELADELRSSVASFKLPAGTGAEIKQKNNGSARGNSDRFGSSFDRDEVTLGELVNA